MSDTMLCGVLRIPPVLWSDDAIDVAQRHQRYLQAAGELERRADEISRLQSVLSEIVSEGEQAEWDGDFFVIIPRQTWIRAAEEARIET